MSYSFEIYGSQIDGARDYQEDAFLVTHLGDKNASSASLVVVADGMGGHAAGNVASNMAVQAFNRNISAKFPSDRLPDVLRESVISANNSIRETVSETAALKGMGCTLVCAVVSDKSLRWVSVGDSHLYLLRGGELRKKNADHSYGGFLDRLAAEGKEVEPEPGFSRNMLMSALTGDEIADIDCPETPLQLELGDRIILCSDGLDTLEHQRILEVCARAGSPRACVEALLEAVVAADQPRQDNTTIVVIDVTEQETAAAAAPGDVDAEPEDDTETPTQRQRTAAADTEPARRPEADTFEPQRSGGGARLALAGVVILALLGAGAWFLLGGGSGQTPPPGDYVAVDEPPAAEPPEEPAPVDTEPPAVDTTAEPGAGAEVPAGPEPAPAPRPAGRTFRDQLAIGVPGPEMVRLPGGSFEMGSKRMSAGLDEKPAHPVRVRPFAIGVYEVTVAEYAGFARATGRPLPKTDAMDPQTTPAHLVSWDDALYYTRWLSEQTGERYRLPSEAEWEYAARAGTGTQYWWGRKIGRGNAHCVGCDSGLDPRKPAPVDSFQPNAFGLYNVSGNVTEWVHDCYHPNYEGAPSQAVVWEGGDCAVRIVRGGSFSSVPDSLRSARRDRFKSDTRLDNIGFRVVRELD